MERALSQQLLDYYFNELDANWEKDLASDELEEVRSTRDFVISLAKGIVWSREKLLRGSFAPLDSIVHSHPELVESILNLHYSVQQLEEIPDLVRRTLQLQALSTKDTPSAQTNLYISEACRAYIFGFQSACVAMSRAALEQSLKERLGRQGDGQFFELRNLLVEASKCNLLDRTGLAAAKDLAKRGDSVLHESPVRDESTALEILCGVRSLLEDIYSAEGHY